MNRAIIVGNLTKAPELRITQSGVAVCTFTVAVNRRFANQDGEREADFIPVVVWRGAAENCAKHLDKGSKVAVCGALQTRSYEDNAGIKRYITEIVADEVQFLPSGSRHQDASPPDEPPQWSSDKLDLRQIEDDELPF